MPELPEVETVRRGLEPVMSGRKITRVRFRRPDLRTSLPTNLNRDIGGQKVAQIERRGKYILALMENGRGFGLHLGMSGRIKIREPGNTEKYGTHDHVVFEMADGTKIIFNDPRRFGMIFSLDEKWSQEKPFSEMGPEPLTDEFDEKILQQKIKKKIGPIKTVLLDQNVVAGIGNIYACEALFHSGIDPRKKANTITPQKISQLVSAIKFVLTLAIRAGGSTLRDHRKTDGSAGYFQHSFSVYDREGKACPGCTCNPVKTGGILRIAQAGRSTFYCPRKQK